MNLRKISVVVFCFVLGMGVFLSCKKEPPLGRYHAVFTGVYDDHNGTAVGYKTEYDFKILHSSKTEIRIQEIKSTTTSTLKKYGGNKIAGKIGIASVYQPDPAANSSTLNVITVEGEYSKTGASTTIRGNYSATVYTGTDGFPSQGEFVLTKQ